MDKQLQVKLEIFVGATAHDLGPAHQAIVNAILAAGHIPCDMGHWAAGNSTPPQTIAQHLGRCDVHILLVGAEYGSIMDGSAGESFTEWEYRQSKDLGRPILSFLLDDASFKASLDLKKSKRKRLSKQDEASLARLQKLRAELQKTKHVKKFSMNEKGLGELQREAVLAIQHLTHSDALAPDAGWIRGDSPEAQTARDVASNEFLKRELDQLRSFSTLGRRVGIDVGAKRAMAWGFWQSMQGRIRRSEYSNLFFESGSTIAYLSDEFVRMVHDGQDAQRWHIHTNNVLSLVYFDLHTAIDASRFPTGVPDPHDEYGAIFPSVWKHLHEPPPARPRGLYQGEREAIESIQTDFKRLQGPQLILATASGVDLDNRMSHFRGPHVGSHPNMLFKRSIFTSGSPVVLFVSANKLGDAFRVGTCYPVFGPDGSWEDAVGRFPLALCVGYEWPKQSAITTRIKPGDARRRNNVSYVKDCLARLGFGVEYFAGSVPRERIRGEGWRASVRGKESIGGAVICGNEAFAKLIPRD